MLSRHPNILRQQVQLPNHFHKPSNTLLSSATFRLCPTKSLATMRYLSIPQGRGPADESNSNQAIDGKVRPCITRISLQPSLRSIRRIRSPLASRCFASESQLSMVAFNSTRCYSTSDSKSPGITNRVYHFILNESKYLSETFKMIAEPRPGSLDLSQLDKSIIKDLSNQIDDYNRFVLLLSHHPLAVPYRILMHYFSILHEVHPSDKKTLLEALIYHNAWDEFWAVALLENPTLTDLEEFIELVYARLHANRNVELGVWLALGSITRKSFNKSILVSICEIIQYKFGISQNKMGLFQKMLTNSYLSSENDFSYDHAVAQLREVQDLADLKAFCIAEMTQVSSHTEQKSRFVVSHCLQDSRLLQIPGFFSLLSAKMRDTQLTDFFATRKTVKYNELDVFNLLKRASHEKHYQLHLSFCHSFKRGPPPSEFIVNHFVTQTHLISERVFSLLVKRNHRSLTIETLSKIAGSLISSSEGRQILKSISKNQKDKFGQLVDKLICAKKSDQILLFMLELSGRRDRLAVRNILKYLEPRKEHINLLSNFNFTCYNLIELWRYGIKRDFLDSTNTGVLFQKILKRGWSTKIFRKRSGTSEDSTLDKNFRKQFEFATPFEKQILKNKLLTLGQALSVAHSTQIARILNSLYVNLREEDHFFMFDDKFGKDFVFNHLIHYMMKFLSQSDEADGGISKMKDVLEHVHFDSIVMQSKIFESMIIKRPELSLEILQSHRLKSSSINRPLMSSIEQGILKSKMNKEERITLFREFHRRKIQLGLSSRLYPTTMILLGNLIFDIAQTCELKYLKEFIRTSYQRGVPPRIIRRWSTKLHKYSKE